MALANTVPNEAHEPDENEETVLELLKAGRDTGRPWGIANPKFIRQETELDKGDVEYALSKLRTAGWIRRKAQGLYEFNSDPRETNE